MLFLLGFQLLTLRIGWYLSAVIFSLSRSFQLPVYLSSAVTSFLSPQWFHSRSASDKYTGIIEKTGSQNASAFQRSINGTLFSGEFSKSLTSEQEAVGAYFASGCIDQ